MGGCENSAVLMASVDGDDFKVCRTSASALAV